MDTSKGISVAETPPIVRPTELEGSLFPFRSRFIDLNGSRVHYVDEGEGPVLLLLHAGPTSSFIYRRFIQRLRPKFRCVALDFPGFGRSEAEHGHPVRLLSLSETVAAFVDALDLQAITLMVHDASGPIGLAAAAGDPTRYAAFVLTDTLAFPLDSYPFIRAMLGLVTGRPFRFVNRSLNLLPWLVSTLAPVRRRLSGEERRIYRRLFPTPRSRDRILDLFRELIVQTAFLRHVEHQVQESLGHKPALIMSGQFDPTRLAGWMRRLEGMFPHHRSGVIPWEGHFPHEGSPDSMIDEILDWAESLRGSSPQPS